MKPDNLLYKWQTAAGNTSQWVSVPGGANFKHLTVTSAGVLYAACTDGTVWTSSNQGTLWTQTQWTGAQVKLKPSRSWVRLTGRTLTKPYWWRAVRMASGSVWSLGIRPLVGVGQAVGEAVGQAV